MNFLQMYYYYYYFATLSIFLFINPKFTIMNSRLVSIFFICFINSAFGQIELKGKKIISTFEKIPQYEPTSTETLKDGVIYENKIGTQYRKVIREISFKEKPAQLMNISRKIRKIRIILKNKTSERIYDSDDTFERDASMNHLAIRYDQYIGKPVESTYNYNTGAFENTYHNIMFEKVWIEANPKLNDIEEWNGIFLFNKPIIKLKETWVDTLKVEGGLSVNKYECKSMDDKKAVISLNISVIEQRSDKPRNAMGVNVKSKTLSDNYEGELIIDLKTKIIDSLILKETVNKSTEIMGQLTTSNTVHKIVITNQVEISK